MNPESLVSCASLAAFVATFFVAVRSVRRKMSAQQRFVELLASPEVAPSLRKLWDEVMQDGVATPAEVDQLVLALDHVTQSLSRADRQLILEGLRQGTVLGRARYIAGMMNRAGIAEGPLPIPIV